MAALGPRLQLARQRTPTTRTSAAPPTDAAALRARTTPAGGEPAGASAAHVTQTNTVACPAITSTPMPEQRAGERWRSPGAAIDLLLCGHPAGKKVLLNATPMAYSAPLVVAADRGWHEHRACDVGRSMAGRAAAPPPSGRMDGVLSWLDRQAAAGTAACGCARPRHDRLARRRRGRGHHLRLH